MSHCSSKDPGGWSSSCLSSNQCSAHTSCIAFSLLLSHCCSSRTPASWDHLSNNYRHQVLVSGSASSHPQMHSLEEGEGTLSIPAELLLARGQCQWMITCSVPQWQKHMSHKTLQNTRSEPQLCTVVGSNPGFLTPGFKLFKTWVNLTQCSEQTCEYSHSLIYSSTHSFIQSSQHL